MIVAVEEAAQLVPMHRIVGGVEIQDQGRRRGVVRGDKLRQQFFMHPPHQRAVRPLFKPAQSRTAAQRLLFIDRGLKGDIVAQRVVIVQVLITAGQAINPLP